MRNRFRVPVMAVVVGVVAALGIAACSPGGGSDRLTVYSGRNEELVAPLIEQFTEKTGIGVDVRYGDSADLALLIDEEGDQAPADVFLSQSPGAIGYLGAEGRLRPIEQSVLDLVNERFRASDGRWVGVSGRVRVLVYNADLVDESDLPTSVFDLIGEQYRDKVASGCLTWFLTIRRIDRVGA